MLLLLLSIFRCLIYFYFFAVYRQLCHVAALHWPLQASAVWLDGEALLHAAALLLDSALLQLLLLFLSQLMHISSDSKKVIRLYRPVCMYVCVLMLQL